MSALDAALHDLEDLLDGQSRRIKLSAVEVMTYDPQEKQRFEAQFFDWRKLDDESRGLVMKGALEVFESAPDCLARDEQGLRWVSESLVPLAIIGEGGLIVAALFLDLSHGDPAPVRIYSTGTSVSNLRVLAASAAELREKAGLRRRLFGIF